jgi:hypothetical protein
MRSHHRRSNRNVGQSQLLASYKLPLFRGVALKLRSDLTIAEAPKLEGAYERRGAILASKKSRISRKSPARLVVIRTGGSIGPQGLE